MVSFRPHTLQKVSSQGAYDAHGDYIVGGQTVGNPVPCRYEPNGQARTIILPDGKAYSYSYTVYLDVNPNLGIQYGDRIRLTSQDGNMIGEFEVKGFHRGQLDMKIWV